MDSPIYVIGFGLYGGIIGPQEYSVNIQVRWSFERNSFKIKILHCGTGKVIAENDTSFVCDGSSSTFRVLFRDPVEITPSVTYIASALLKVRGEKLLQFIMNFRVTTLTTERKDSVELSINIMAEVWRSNSPTLQETTMGRVSKTVRSRRLCSTQSTEIH